MKYLGSHVSLSAPDYFLGAVNEALSYASSAFMFYTGAPQNTKRKPLSELKIPEGLAKMEEAGLRHDKIVVHAPYVINLANDEKPDSFAFAKEFLIEELRRAFAFKAKWVVLHPGSHVGRGMEKGYAALKEGLLEVFSKDGTDVTLCLETMAGKGSEIGVDFISLGEFISSFPLKERLGVCLDTCHVNDAGYEVDGKLLDFFDEAIGLDRLKVVHLNDSKNERGAHKDRHENIGFGTLGFKRLSSFIRDERLEEIPIILETPYIGEKAPYGEEIAMLRKNVFDPLWRKPYE